MRKTTPDAPRCTMRNEKGFTLIELVVVVIIIGLITMIGMANFFHLKNNSLRASCISNQRNIAEAAVLYGMENGISNATFNVADLAAGRYVDIKVAECPASGDDNGLDYTITLTDEKLTEIKCDIKPGEHHWAPPP